MLSYIVYPILTLLIIGSYFKRDKTSFLTLLFFMVFECMGFVHPSSGRFVYNFYLLIIVSVIIFHCMNGENILSVKNDRIGKIILLIIAYRTLITLWAIITQVDTAINCLLQYRFSFILLGYFIYKQIDIDTILRVLPRIIRLSIVGFVAFLFGQILQVEGLEVNWSFRYVVLSMAPVILLMCLLDKSIHIKNRRGILVFTAFILFILLMRSLFATVAITILIYMTFIKKSGKAVVGGALIAVIMYIGLGFLDSRKGKGGSNDIRTELEYLRSASDYSDFNSSSGVLRYIIVLERVDHMISRPVKFLFGYGPIRESSPQNKFDFISGSHGDDEVGNTKILQIDSNDVAFISDFLRYGIIYIILYFVFLKRALQLFYKYRNKRLMTTGLLTCMVMILTIPTTDYFGDEHSMFMLLLLVSVASKISVQNKKENVLVQSYN